MTKSPALKEIDRAFPPLESATTKVLILGSMPSQKSLSLGQYYGHPQNAFWRIMEKLTGVSFDSAYEERADAVLKRGISIWDTIASCHRPGSMDADIDPQSVSVNDFEYFFRRHEKLCLVLFNGQSSAKTFVRHHGKSYLAGLGIESETMPSTSPAYASMSLSEKCRIWCAALERVL